MPGETLVDWTTLLQIALALGILSLCCWLLGITIAARIQAWRRQRPTRLHKAKHEAVRSHIRRSTAPSPHRRTTEDVS
ncbi:hypothetical protein [Roseiflexus sp.]|uniref:hypothetical protein n=1 Tax=Roseiflexus sp. TaxID=2562120 RepID=UPI0021DE7C09|nr:hypothetical protein [Roseiflexus sp.]GIV99736.1 MAG: hypothetical protein KatS3mg058_1140 [Roseiflexus sp.]